MTEDFYHLPPVSTTPVVHLELRISPRIFEKIWNSPNVILRGLGETDSWKKNQNLIILWHCPFNGGFKIVFAMPVCKKRIWDRYRNTMSYKNLLTGLLPPADLTSWGCSSQEKVQPNLFGKKQSTSMKFNYFCMNVTINRWVNFEHCTITCQIYHLIIIMYFCA